MRINKLIKKGNYSYLSQMREMSCILNFIGGLPYKSQGDTFLKFRKKIGQIEVKDKIICNTVTM